MRLIYIFSVKASLTLRSTAGVVIIRRGVCCQVAAKVISCPHREGWEWGWARQDMGGGMGPSIRETEAQRGQGYSSANKASRT